MTMSMRFAAALAVMLAASPAWAGGAGTRYEAAYTLTGYRLRAVAACPGDKRAMTERAFAPVSSSELQAFSKAFPQTIETWMRQGAGLFNAGVMQNGIEEACRKAH